MADEERAEEQEDQDQELNELTDIEVVTLGLVRSGANRREYLLLKSQEEPVTVDLSGIEDASELGEQIKPGFFEKLAATFRAELDKWRGEAAAEIVSESEGGDVDPSNLPESSDIPVDNNGGPTPTEKDDASPERQVQGTCLERLVQGGDNPATDGVDTPEEAEMSEEQVIVEEQEVVEDAQVDVTPEDGVEDAPQTVEKADTVANHVDEVTKAKLDDALVRLQKTEELLAKEQERRERAEWLQKASVIVAIPVKADELADKLYAVAKHDLELAEWFTEALKAADAQAQEAGLFKERGTSQEGGESQDLDAACKMAVEKGEFENYGDAFVALSADPRFAGYLRDRRRTMREG